MFVQVLTYLSVWFSPPTQYCNNHILGFLDRLLDRCSWRQFSYGLFLMRKNKKRVQINIKIEWSGTREFGQPVVTCGTDSHSGTAGRASFSTKKGAILWNLLWELSAFYIFGKIFEVERSSKVSSAWVYVWMVISPNEHNTCVHDGTKNSLGVLVWIFTMLLYHTVKILCLSGWMLNFATSFSSLSVKYIYSNAPFRLNNSNCQKKPKTPNLGT